MKNLTSVSKKVTMIMDDLRFLVLLTEYDYVIFLVDANYRVYSLVHNESKFVGISQLSITVSEKKA